MMVNKIDRPNTTPTVRDICKVSKYLLLRDKIVVTKTRNDLK